MPDTVPQPERMTIASNNDLYVIGASSWSASIPQTTGSKQPCQSGTETKEQAEACSLFARSSFDQKPNVRPAEADVTLASSRSTAPTMLAPPPRL
jgi:hypothetical protein